MVNLRFSSCVGRFGHEDVWGELAREAVKSHHSVPPYSDYEMPRPVRLVGESDAAPEKFDASFLLSKVVCRHQRFVRTDGPALRIVVFGFALPAVNHHGFASG